MNIKYQLILWQPLDPDIYIISKVMHGDQHGKQGVYSHIRSTLSAASQERGVFNFFHIEDEDGNDNYIGYEQMQKYCITIKWL